MTILGHSLSHLNIQKNILSLRPSLGFQSLQNQTTLLRLKYRPSIYTDTTFFFTLKSDYFMDKVLKFFHSPHQNSLNNLFLSELWDLKLAIKLAQ